MAISQKQIMDRAYRVTIGVAQDAHDSPSADVQFVFEDLFPIALREACKAELKGDPQSLRRKYVLTFVDGTAPLPDTVLEEFMDQSLLVDSTIPESADLNSYQVQLHNYYYPANLQLGHYAIDAGNLKYRQPGGLADDYSGNGTLFTVGMPTIPGSITADLGISTELAERVIMILAAIVKGTPPTQAEEVVSV